MVFFFKRLDQTYFTGSRQRWETLIKMEGMAGAHADLGWKLSDLGANSNPLGGIPIPFKQVLPSDANSELAIS